MLKLYAMMKERGVDRVLARQLSMAEFRSLADENKTPSSSFRKAFRLKLQQRVMVLAGMEAGALGKYDRLEEETSTTRHSDHHGIEEDEVRAT